MKETEFDFAIGTALAEKGMLLASSASRVQSWQESADHWLSMQATCEFTADDLVKAVGLPSRGANQNNSVGAWISAQAKQRRIVFTGRFSKSERKDRHIGLQRIWAKR